eukprot:599315-Rhodomonas_salina.1
MDTRTPGTRVPRVPPVYPGIVHGHTNLYAPVRACVRTPKKKEKPKSTQAQGRVCTPCKAPTSINTTLVSTRFEIYGVLRCSRTMYGNQEKSYQIRIRHEEVTGQQILYFIHSEPLCILILRTTTQTFSSKMDHTKSSHFVPAHVQQWVCEMQDRASRPHSLKEATSSEVVLHNEIEAEVIEGGRRCTSVTSESSHDEDESQAFGRHMFENKKAHR